MPAAQYFNRSSIWRCLLVLLPVIAQVLFVAVVSAAQPAIDFNRDIRPILSDKCIRCHGPDSNARQADLRFDREQSAKSVHEGKTPVVPGKPQESELFLRITNKDADERMPPEKSGKTLSPTEIELFRRWIADGAQWMPAWNYMPPKRIHLEAVNSGNWIDQLVSTRLQSEHLKPSLEADKITLIRRLNIDLVGLPPTPEEVDAFLKDDRPDAYERLVDRLLASPHFGERLAIYWLDLVRYADTVGYHGDQEQHISPYRDYVIDSFNRNLPFDQFTREQLAGDLLPDPTVEQKVATGYNRLLQTSHEGGVQKKEYLAIYAADRVRNFSNVWMGGTMGCAQCHDHKYDPYTAKDFYSMQAFFADIDEDRHLNTSFNGNTSPTIRDPELELPTEQQKQQIAALEKKLAGLQLESRRPAAKKSAIAEKPTVEKPTETSDATSGESESDGENGKSAADDKSAATAGDEKPTKPAGNSPRNVQREITALQNELKAAKAKVLRSMITVAKEPRVIRILPRGNWLDDSGDIVQPAIPEFMGKLNTGDRRATRLDLANWLVDSKAGVGGLTARVMANRFWYLMFGRGIAPVLDDFGGQGQPPSNPELLDALAVEFADSGWDIKHMFKLIAMSRAYRQASTETPELQERDPLNQFFARQSKFRYPAEAVRDSTLLVSGLLIDKLDGPSVKPYQPAGYYRHLNFPEREYQQDNDDRQWRRGVYMHWQRQYLHPMLKAFDAPTREECTAQRSQSNTPLAALVLLNDPSFVEAARSFAARILHESATKQGADDKDDKSVAVNKKIDFAFRWATSRKADVDEQKLMQKLLEESRAYYANHHDDADKLLAIGLKSVPKDLDHVELASWTIVARSILSMNEALTRN